MRLETACETGGIFELSAGMHTGGPRPPAAKAKGKLGSDSQPLAPELDAVTQTLQNIMMSSRSKAMLDASRAFKAINSEAFQSSLAESPQNLVDAFIAALEQAAGFFTLLQRQRIVEWTGLSLPDEVLSAEMAPDQEEQAGGQNPDVDPGADDDDLDQQLAELKGEVTDRSKGISAAKRRRIEDTPGAAAARARPDWNGQAAPETPAAIAARAWAARRAGIRPQPPTNAPWQPTTGASRHPPPQRRSWGIASLDTSSMLHGKSAGGFGFGQLSQHADTEQFADAKNGNGQTQHRKPQIRLAKGLPTVAPMTPAHNRNAAEI